MAGSCRKWKMEVCSRCLYILLQTTPTSSSSSSLSSSDSTSTPVLSSTSIPLTSPSSDIVQQEIVRPTQRKTSTFSPTSQSDMISSLSSSSSISDVDKMIENFHYAPFTLGPISSINMEEAGLALRQAGLTQVAFYFYCYYFYGARPCHPHPHLQI